IRNPLQRRGCRRQVGRRGNLRCNIRWGWQIKRLGNFGRRRLDDGHLKYCFAALYAIAVPKVDLLHALAINQRPIAAFQVDQSTRRRIRLDAEMIAREVGVFVQTPTDILTPAYDQRVVELKTELLAHMRAGNDRERDGRSDSTILNSRS